ncbi:hypothetical protein JW977_01570 [Candidatus Falkowbacteria bacterium]|nr:hypothetical protein [Candidatus Falkowbacteria bacterium]
MKDKKEWFRNYGLILKIVSGLVLFIWLGGLNIIIFLREDPSASSYNSTLDSFDRPPTYSGPKFEDWKVRHDAAKAESDAILKRAKSRGDNYKFYDYFNDFNELMDLEDKYHIFLTSPALFSPLGELVKLRDQRGVFEKQQTMRDEENSKFIIAVGDRSDRRNGIVAAKTSIDNKALLISAVKWLSIVYLKFMFFWFFIYILRFAEKDKSMRRFQFHHHELGRFVDSQEPFPGFLSFKEEVLLCPFRLLTRLLLWPKYCFAYPHYEDTAEHIRYLRLKARFLQGKPLVYQLSESEDRWLHSQAQAPIKEFEKTLKDLVEFEISPQFVRKSLAVAYLSLILGVFLQPFIVLAAKSSSKINEHFYGQPSRIEMVAHFENGERDGPPSDSSSSQSADNIFHEFLAPQKFELVIASSWEFIKALKFIMKIKILPDAIFHVPLYSVV